MRDPVQPVAGSAIVAYQGVWRNGGANNQTGGTLYYRYGATAWQSAPLGFHVDKDQNQFWKATIPSGPGSVPLQYYFRVVFSNQPATFLYKSGTSLNENVAQADPVSVMTALRLTVTSAAGNLNANYTTSKLYADEVNGTFGSVIVELDTGTSTTVEAEVWTNLNNRGRAAVDADNDGIHDGIVSPPAPTEKPQGYSSGPYPANGYFQAIPMTPVGNGVYRLELGASKTGAYRLSARYRVAGDTSWRWYGASGAKDHCITVAPMLSREMNIYEINVFNVDATGSTFGGRSTFESLTDNQRWNLTWLRNAGANTLWFQPIHPVAVSGREPSGGWDTQTPPYDPGSPYAVKNFFEVNELMSSNYHGTNSVSVNRSASMTAFQDFVQVADATGVNVILDAPFNHSAHDLEVSSPGIALLQSAGVNTSGWAPTDEMRNREARFFSRNDGGFAYAGPASSAGNIAQAPDRTDFGKWRDVNDVFFGRYAALVTGNPDNDTSRNTSRNEGDWLNTEDLTGALGSNGAVTRAVWQYFAAYVPYWLEKTGLPAGSTLQVQTTKGIDGLRADFGQGMPPQFWEYCINVARTHKWSFVFMSESLDGGAVTYRSNRHFDILNENIVFPWQQASTTGAHKSIFDDRRRAYGQGLVLLNNTSHDEAGYADPWQAWIRYAVGSTMDGAPMIMYGQEIGTSDLLSFDNYELNFGKYIPHFKRWNSMLPQWLAWEANSLGVQHLLPSYAGTGKARQSSPALRSSNRWFLNAGQTGESDPNIFAVAKYASPNTPVAQSDSAFCFVNLDRTQPRANTFSVPVALADLMGLKSGRSYNVKNMSAYTGTNGALQYRKEQLLWGTGRTREDIVANGIYAALSGIPNSEQGWAIAPYEAQFLKILDVSPPPASGTPTLSPWSVDGSTTATWVAANDPDGPPPMYLVYLLDKNGATAQVIQTTNTTTSFTNLQPGTYSVSVTSANPNDTSKTGGTSGPSGQSKVLDPTGDEDGDGMANGGEAKMGTDPLDPTSLTTLGIDRSGGNIVLTWDAIDGVSYHVEAGDLSGAWEVVSTTARGTYSEPATYQTRFYRVVVP